MKRSDKELVVKKITETLDRVSVVYLLSVGSVDAETDFAIRSKMREGGVSFTLVKNSLVDIAANNLEMGFFSEFLSNKIAIAVADDIVSSAKIIAQVEKEFEEITCLCGSYNKEFMDKQSVKKYSSLPSLEELHCKIVSCIRAPSLKVVNSIQGAPMKLAAVLRAYEKSGE